MEKFHEPKRLYRSNTNRIFAGICGGLGEYFNIDPVIFRALWILITVFTAVIPGIVAYILLIFVIPEWRNSNGKRIHDIPPSA